MGGCGGGCDQLVMVVGSGGCWRRAGRRGRSSSELGGGALLAFVVSCGVRVVDGGGRLWAVVEFVIVSSDVVGARCCSCWCRGGVIGGAHIVAGGRLWAVVVVVVTSW